MVPPASGMDPTATAARSPATPAPTATAMALRGCTSARISSSPRLPTRAFKPGPPARVGIDACRALCSDAPGHGWGNGAHRPALRATLVGHPRRLSAPRHPGLPRHRRRSERFAAVYDPAPGILVGQPRDRRLLVDGAL